MRYMRRFQGCSDLPPLRPYMLLAIPYRYAEGDVATVTGRREGLPLGRFLREAQTSSGYGQSRAHVNRNTFDLRVVDRADHRRVRRINLDDLDAPAKRRSFDAGDRLVTGKR